MKNYKEEYWDHWQSIVEKDGQLDLDSVQRELSDYSMVMDIAAEVYCHITGNRISKVNTLASEIITQAEEIQEEHIQEAIEEATADMKLQLRAARKALDKIQDQALVPQSDQKDYMKCPDIAIAAIQELIKLGYTDSRVCACPRANDAPIFHRRGCPHYAETH